MEKSSELFPKERYTKFELARILGARALQISFNAPILIKIDKETIEKLRYDPIKIAELELSSGILPISIKRPFPKKTEKKIEEEKEPEALKEAIKEEPSRKKEKKEKETKKEEEKPENPEEILEKSIEEIEEKKEVKKPVVVDEGKSDEDVLLEEIESEQPEAEIDDVD